MKKKGFTLIELLAVIIILAVIALIATPVVLNIVNETRKNAAQLSITSYVKAIESKILYSSVENIKYEDKENYAYDEIKVDMQGTIPTEGIYSLKNGIVESGTFCIDGYMVNYTNSTSQVVDKGCNVENLKLSGSIKLSSNNGNYTYPEIGTFEVIENISEGELSCTSSDESVATCSISGTTVTVTPGTTEGSSTITITSKSTGVYKEANAVYVAITAKGLLSYTANGYTGTYDGSSHGITVTSSGATITYSIDETNYSSINPTYIDAGTYTVYYKIEREGYNTITGSKDVVINKASGSVTVPTAKTLTYTENAQELINAGSSSTGTMQYKLNNGSYTENIPTATNAGMYTVYYKVVGDANHNDVAEASITVTIAKANNTLTLSSNNATYIYPSSGTFEVIENASEGELSCTSSNISVATCSISGTVVTVTPGTTAGNANIIVTSEATENYNEAQITHVAITASGLLSYTSNGYTGIYDGSAHGITVTSSGATITYSTDETNYSVTNPTYIDAGTYTVYYKIEKAGYNTVTGSKTVVINKASGSATLSATSGTVYTGKTMTFTVSGATGTLSCTSSNISVATCSISGTTVTVNGIESGTTTITVNVASSTNYNAISKTYFITVVIPTLSDIVSLGDYITYRPINTSYTPNVTLSGCAEYSLCSQPSLNPSELTSWRVLKINSDGTIDIVSTNVSTDKVYFYSKTGYINFVKVLNDTSKAYINSTYAITARALGYDGQTEELTDTTVLTQTIAPWTSSTSDNSNEAQGGGDISYLKDINQMISSGIGLSTTNNSGLESYYWLGSRYYYYSNSSDYYYGGRIVYTNDNVGNYGLYNYYNGFHEYDGSYAFRPVVTLKSGLQTTGTGTSEDPYVLK